MDTQEPTQQPAPEPQPVKKEGGTGALIASVIIIILLGLGAFYLLTSLDDNDEPQEDDIAELEAELEEEDFDDVDRDMETLEAEFDASLE